MTAPTPETEDKTWQRLDKWLWCARFLKARADCARLVAQGHVRINRQPTDKPHARLRPGDILTLPLRGDVLVLQVNALAHRRGPAPEARTLYDTLGDPALRDPALRDTPNDCISASPAQPTTAPPPPDETRSQR